jgi:hypothetical protein
VEVLASLLFVLAISLAGWLFSLLGESVLVFAISSTFFIAFAWISFCFAGSFAMIETRSVGTGVVNLKLLANFFSSVDLTSLSARALWFRAFSALLRC